MADSVQKINSVSLGDRYLVKNLRLKVFKKRGDLLDRTSPFREEKYGVVAELVKSKQSSRDLFHQVCGIISFFFEHLVSMSLK